MNASLAFELLRQTPLDRRVGRGTEARRPQASASAAMSVPWLTC
jgi:hypothetical protein